jgi:hypothetical protein
MLNFPPLDSGTYLFTVTKPDHIPHLGRVIVSPASRQVTASSYVIDDDTDGTSSGNGDGYVNPGETIELDAWLKNLGDSSCNSIEATISAADDGLTIHDSTDSFGDISPGDSSMGSGGYVVHIADSVRDREKLRIAVTAVDGAKGQWISEIVLDVFAPRYVYTEHSIMDLTGGTVLDPGETAELTVAISNSGRLDADSVTATLSSPASAIRILDASGYYGYIHAGASAENGSDAFVIKADPTCHRGYTTNLCLRLSGPPGFDKEVMFPVTVGKVSPSAPMGPDNYGYYAFDDTDTDYTEAPVFNWIELDTAYGGQGIPLPLGDDETITLPLPFDFTYYGRTYDQLSVCSNGWVAMGDEYYIDFKNTAIPAAMGPYAMIAPLWDDHDPEHESSSGVFYQYDATNHRFIVEWSRLESSEETNLLTFEAVLFDPTYHSTSTGDGEILFNYYKVANIDTSNDYLTTGIESPDQNDGLQYTYANIYHPAARTLADGRAIKFTTDPPKLSHFRVNPTYGEGSWTRPVDIRSSYPNPFAPSTTIELEVGVRASVRLAVYDINGRLVKSIGEGSFEPGIRIFEWDGRDDAGAQAASGVYFLRAESETGHCMSKVVKLR